MKKIITLLPIVTSVAIFSSCGANIGPKSTLYWSAYNTENFMSYDAEETFSNYFSKEDSGYDVSSRSVELNYSMLKNEKEGAQIIVRPNHFVRSFNLTIDGDLSDGSGHSLKTDNFTIYAVKYIEVTSSNDKPYSPATKRKQVISGFYPDAIIPIDKYILFGDNYIEKNHNQAFFIDLFIPKDTVAGTYTGSATITLDEETKPIPIKVKVYNAEMCDEVHARDMILLWYEQNSLGEGSNAGLEMDEFYYNYLAENRISADALPSAYYTDYDTLTNAYVEKVMNNPKISTYRLRPTGDSSSFKNKCKEYLTAFARKNKELFDSGDTNADIFKKLMFYVDDEPTEASFPTVRFHDKAIAEAKREVANSELSDSKYSNIKESLMKVGNLVTKGFAAGQIDLFGKDYIDDKGELVCEGGIQTWCPQFQHFDNVDKRAMYRARQFKENTDREYGEQVWWYGCMDPQSPYPSYHLNADLLNSRVITWMQWNYHIEGSIFWCANYYSKTTSSGTVARDVWNDPITWLNTVGDGYLLYPGLQYGVYGPIPTLRFKSVSNSQEDYEYFYFLENKVNEYNKKEGTNYDVRELLGKLFSTIYEDVYLVNNGIDGDENFFNAREKILDVIETFSSSDEGALQKGMDKLIALSK